MGLRSAIAVFLALGWGAACGDDGSTPDAAADSGMDAGDAAPPPGGAVAIFDPPAEGAPAWGVLPFPHDLFRGDDGTVEMASLPADNALWDTMLPRLNERDGFSRSGSIAFPIEGRLDPTSLPGDADPGATPSASDPIVLMRADREGGLIPLMMEFSPVDAALLIRPQHGHVLAPATTYVAAVTSAIRGEDGMPLAASATFAAVRDGGDGGPGAERARPIVEPAIESLVAAGLTREALVSVAVFTTADTGGHLAALRALARAGDPPAAVLDRSWTGAIELDDLFGTPAEARPGLLVPAETGTEGEWAVWHDAVEAVVTGTFPSPRVVEGSGTEVGRLRRDASGMVTTGPVPEDVTFVLTVPRGADLTRLPVVVLQHGVPGSRALGLIIANTLARAGIAAIALDGFQMGARAATATDLVHDLRGGDLGPDGFEEFDGTNAALRFQGASGVPGGTELDQDYPLAASSQWIVDILSTVRLVREGDVAAVSTGVPGLAGLAFDPEQVFFLGLSYGTVTGIPAMAAADGVAAAVFNVPASDAMDITCHSPANRPLAEPAVVPALGIRGRFDEVTRRMCLSPVISLVRWYGEPVMPITAMHYLLEQPLTDDTPDLLFQTAGLDQALGRPTTEAIVAAAHVPAVGPFDFTDVPAGTPPISANRSTPHGDITAAGFMYPDATHDILYQRDVQTRWDPPFAPPFRELDMPRDVANPIEDAHAQIVHFLQSRISTGRAEVVDAAGP